MAIGIYMLVAVGCAVVLARLVNAWGSSKRDFKEPPVIPGIPILGHLLAVIRYGTSFQDVMRLKTNNYPIYTVYVLDQRIYTIGSPELVSVLNRNQKHLDTETGFVTTVFQNMLGVDRTAMELLMSRPKPGERITRTPFREAIRSTEHRFLAPGESMEKLHCAMMREVSKSLENIIRQDKTKVQLMAWLEELLTTGAGRALYGKKSPFNTDPSLIQDYWLYDSVITVFLLNFFPKYVVPKAFKARERLVDRFKVYHRNSESSDMADLIRRRVQICRQYGCSDDYLGRSELELVNGLLSNMVPTLFWMLTHIVLDGSLASTINNEVAQILQPKNGEGASSSTTNTTTLHFEFAQVRDKCPTLVATYHEVLRLYASSARAYQVTEDFMLTDNYLLRKGSMVTIPVEVLHKSPNNWGPDASQFRPNRWINPDSAPHHPAAWAPFGGGSSICPGRYFVFDLILSIAIMVLYSFDLEIVSGEKQLPERRTKIMSGVRLPEKDPDILMRRRRRADQDGEVVWSFKKEASPSVKERD